jgi:transcriptional regulator with XRE-family HTH domain
MPRVAIRPSRDLADLLRQRRKELNLTLREAEERTRAYGKVIPFSTLGKVEQGRVDPGVVRFQQLLDIYDIPKEVALDVVALETLRGEAPRKGDPQELYDQAVRFWKAGEIGRALGAMHALREAVADRPQHRALRQKAQLQFAVVVGGLGRFNLSKYLLEQLLREPLPPPTMLRAFVQLAHCWQRLGVQELALAMLARATSFAKDAGPAEAGFVAHEFGLIELARESFAAAREHLREARKLYRSAKDDLRVFKVDMALARTELLAGEAKQALPLAQQLAKNADAHPAMRPSALVLLGHAQLACRQLEPAIATLRSGLSAAVAADDACGRYIAHHYLALAYAEAGDNAKAAMERHAADQFKQHVDFEPDKVVFQGGKVAAVPAERPAPRKRRGRRATA